MAKHMAGAPEKTQRTHLKHESEKQPVQADTGKRYRAEVPQSETSYDNGKRYKKEKTESSRPKREEHTSTHSNPTRTISEGGMNHLAARLEERDERRYAACRAAYGERRTQQSPARLRTEDEPVVRKSKAMKTARMKLPAHVLKSRAKLIFGGAAGIVAVLVITALLAMPHQNAEPVEAAAEPEALAAATPTPEPAFQQLGDWRLVLVNSEVPLPDDFQMTPTLFDTITVNSKMYPELTALINAAYNDEINLWVASGYRSVEEQESVLDRAVQRRMADGMTYEKAYEDARITIQAPGYSEHHTGLAVDFNDVEDDFRETEAYTWLQEHAAEYGFVERYPKGKESITGIDYEPWHYRYVGKEHAQRMNELNMCLEEYVAFLKGD